MSISIHPYLIARLRAVQAAFMQPGFQVPTIAFENSSTTTPNDWKKLLNDDDEGDGGGGGGTIKGNRGKNAEHAKAAMRRLTRAGGR